MTAATATVSAAVSAGLSALGEDADHIRAVESLSVPLGGGGVSGEMRVFVFEGMGVLTRWASEGCAEVAAVGADEPELPGAGGQDLERSGVMGDVVTFTQGRPSHESCVAGRVWGFCLKG